MKHIAASVLLLLTTAVLPAEEAPLPAQPLPGVLRSRGRIFLMENHSTAYLVWHSLKIQGATLVHLDAHDDCRYVPPEKLDTLRELLSRNDYESIFRQSDLGSYDRFETRPKLALYDLGNFIYPCIRDGTVSNFWWIVPNPTLDDATKQFLQMHLREALRLPANLNVFDDQPGRFSFALSNAVVTVSTLNALPTIPPGALLDIDTDFFVFAKALADTHLRDPLIWSPAAVLSNLSQRLPKPSVVTICASVGGGYLPLACRFIPDVCFEFALTGTYPVYANRLQQTVETLWTKPLSASLPPPPDDTTFDAAHHHLSGLFLLMKGDEDEAMRQLMKAAELSPVYLKGLLDAAEALMYMGRFKAAHAGIDRFEKTMGRETIPSLSTRVLVCLEQHDTRRAEALARKLLDWDKQPYVQLLYAGALTQQGKTEEAMALYQDVIKQSPNNPVALYDMGVLREQKGETDPAIELYRAALLLRPSFAAAHEKLGYLLSSKGEADGAIQSLSTAAEINPFNVTTWNNLGLALFRRGQLKPAITACENAVKLNPQMPEIHANFGLVLAAAGRTGDAVAHYQEALRLRPDWNEVRVALDDLLKQGKPD